MGKRLNLLCGHTHMTTLVDIGKTRIQGHEDTVIQPEEYQAGKL